MGFLLGEGAALDISGKLVSWGVFSVLSGLIVPISGNARILIHSVKNMAYS